MTINYRLFDFKKFTSVTTDNSLDTAIQTAASKTTSAAILANQVLLGVDTSALVTSGNSSNSTNTSTTGTKASANQPNTLLSKIPEIVSLHSVAEIAVTDDIPSSNNLPESCTVLTIP